MSKKVALSTAQTALVMSVMTIVTKVLGFVREIVLAKYFGAGVVTDAYVMAQSIPNSLLAAVISAVGISFMPVFSQKAEKEGQDAADRFTSQVINLLTVIIAAAVLLALIFTEPLVGFFAPGFSGETQELTVFYLRIIFFVLFANAAIYIFTAYLNYKNIFLPQVIYGFLQNLMLIICVYAAAKTDCRVLAAGPVAGGFIAGLLIVLKAKRSGFSYTPDFHLSGAAKTVLELALPVFIGGYVNQINLAIDKILASGLPNGSVSALNYASHMIDSITALTVAVFVTVLYPKLNKAFANLDYPEISSLSEYGIKITSIFAIPISLGLLLYSGPVIRLIYERGEFGPEAVRLTSAALAAYGIGFVFLSLNTYITRIYYSLRDTKTAVKCSAVSVVLNIILNFILIKSMAHAGLALATSIAQAVQTGLLVFTFVRRYPKIKLLSSPAPVIRLSLAAAAAVGSSFLLYRFLLVKLSMAAALLLGVAFSVAVYLLILTVFRFEEVSLLKEMFGKNK